MIDLRYPMKPSNSDSGALSNLIRAKAVGLKSEVVCSVLDARKAAEEEMSNLGDGAPDFARSYRFASLNQIKIVDKTQSNGVFVWNSPSANAGP